MQQHEEIKAFPVPWLVHTQHNETPSQPSQTTACTATPRHPVQEQRETTTMDVSMRGSTGHSSSLLYCCPTGTTLGELPVRIRSVSSLVELVPTPCSVGAIPPPGWFSCASVNSSVSICQAREVTGKELISLLLSKHGTGFLHSTQLQH